jgi:hypothetical protein
VWQDHLNDFPDRLDPLKLTPSQKLAGWLSKKRQMQGAQLSRNEAYSGTPQ